MTRAKKSPSPTGSLMNSMTGHGRGQATVGGVSATVEVTSVNRKQLEVSVSAPRELEPLEPRIREVVSKNASRGRVNVRCAVELGETGWAGQVHVNKPLAKAYARQLAELAKELGLPGLASIETIARLPGVIQSPEAGEDLEPFWKSIEAALAKALEAFKIMRRREGAHLASDLSGRVKILRQLAARIEKHVPAATERYRGQLIERIRAAGVDGISPDDDRVLKEVVLFADRTDVTEELTRLQSHFAQFETTILSKEPVGRTLDFLAQEMNREINTVGSKSADAAISTSVIEFKAELERFREQAQNVE